MTTESPVVATPAVAAPSDVAAVEAPKPVEIPAAVLERERIVRAAQDKLAHERAEVAKQRAEVESWKADRAREVDAKADPLEKIDRAHSRLSQLEESIKTREAAAELRSWREAKTKEVEAGQDKYELTLLHGYAHLVPARIEAHWQRTGDMLSTDSVAADLERELEAATEKSLASKKWKARSAAAAVPPPASPPAAAKPAAP